MINISLKKQGKYYSVYINDLELRCDSSEDAKMLKYELELIFAQYKKEILYGVKK